MTSMLRIGLVALTVLLPVVGQAQQSRVCDVLATRIAQSPGALKDRLLSEALFEAASLDCPKIAAELLARGASVEARNRFGATALNTAAGRGAQEVARLLLAAGADIEHANLDGATPLLYAVRDGRRKMAQDLLAAGAMVNVADKQGVTPLMSAAFEGDARLLKLLLEAGARTGDSDIQGKGAMVYAAGRAYPDIVAALLAAGDRADAVWGNDLTALMWAAGHANEAPARDGVRVAELLIGAGVPVNAADNRGRSALMIAAERGHGEMVQFLLEAGADATLRDKAGLTAADLAASAEIRALLD